MRKTIPLTIRTLAAIAAMSAALSCQKELATPDRPAEAASEITVSVREEDAVETKSSLSLSETSVKRVSVGIYDATTGALAASATASGSSVTVSGLVKGRTYRAYALTNTSATFSGHAAASGLTGMSLDIGSYPALASSGIPMASDGYTQFTCGAVQSITVPVKRLAAKYSFRVDRSRLDEGSVTVKSVSVKQAATTVYPFEAPDERWTAYVGNGDSASASDISSLNGGGSVVFYAMENCQGTLLPGNTDPWSKVPTSISSRKNCCTYLELTCSYSSPSKESDNVTYRMYLGANATTNFDIERNKTYTLTFRPTDDGLDRTSWKIDPGDVTTYSEEHELVVSPASASIKVGGTKQFTATYRSYHYTNGVLTDTEEDDVTGSASWSSSRTSVATVSGGNVTGAGAGSATVTASYRGESADASITVTDDITYQYELKVTPASASVLVGGTRSFTATYYTYTYTNGTRTATASQNVTSSASWSSSSTTVATVSSGTATGRRAGTATITATYSGKSASASLAVSDDVTTEHELVITPASASVNVGSTRSFTATYYTYTYTNGSLTNTSSSDVTASASWSSSSTSVATVSSGTATGRSSGTATITATHSGESATAALTVNDVVTYDNELKVTPASASVNVGSTRSFTATYYTYTYTNGSLTNTTSSNVTSSASWSSSRTSVATVTRGTATGVSSGTATISATYAGKSGSATLTVDDVVTYGYELKVTPAAASVNVGSTVSFAATYYTYTYTNGSLTGTATQNVTTSASWSSSRTSVATVSGGTARGVASGTATITATYQGKSGSATLTVNDVVTYEYDLIVTPSSATIHVGGTRAFTAMYYTHTYTNGSLTNTASQNVTSSAAWSSSSTTTATVSGGTATGRRAGTATITATYSGKSASATLTVQDLVETRYRIILTPSETTILEGQTVTYTVKRYADTYTNGTLTSTDTTGATIANSLCSWSIYDGTGVATVSSAGVATGVSIGRAVVRAALKSDSSVWNTAVVNVDFNINVDPGTGGSGSGGNNF